MPLPNERELADLLNVWEARAREAREHSRSNRVGDVQTAYYYKGVSDTYQQVMGELKSLLESEVQQTTAEAPAYRRVTRQQVSELLHRVGLHPRELNIHSDHAITAVFSRLQPVSQEQRIRLLSDASPSIVVLDYGKLPGTNEPFIDFAFMDTPEADQKM